jgi:hypothetical protein
MLVNKVKYYNFMKELEALELTTSPSMYLSDEGVDLENAQAVHDEYKLTRYDEAYWEILIVVAESAAGSRAEDYGLNINKLLGRSIY